MARSGSGFSLYSLSLLATLGVAGCVMPGASGTSAPPSGDMASQSAAADTGPASRVIERDVEAPDVFQVEDRGLWDGRPSLGGVWVAHPTATDPERVVIRNPDTGASVIGALFRRERENPGPRFQISSEAADALGILAGAPTDIAVTALRLERVEMEIDPAPETTTTAADETLAIAPVAAPPTADGATATPAGPAQGQVAVQSEEPERRGLFGLFGRRDRDTPREDAIETTTLAPSTAPVAGVAAGSAAATQAGTTFASTTVEAATPQPRQERRGFLSRLFSRDEPEPDTTTIAVPIAPETQSAAAQAPTPQAPTPSGARISRPFVQIGIFSVEQNAINARARMQQAGLDASIRRGQAGDNQFWRVVVGPAGSTDQRDTFLRQVRSMGFTDAYAVVR